MTAQETKHYGMPVFSFLEKRKNAGQASGLSTILWLPLLRQHPSTAVVLSLTHWTHKIHDTCHTFKYSNWQQPPLHEDVVEAF